MRETTLMTEESLSIRLVRIESRQEIQGQILERTATAVEAIAVISERMANHMEDVKRMHNRIDLCETDIVSLQTQTAETHAFYKDVKRGIIALLTTLLGGVAWLLQFWMERHG